MGGRPSSRRPKFSRLKTGDELTVLVGDGEDEIYFVDLDVEGLNGLLLILTAGAAGGVWPTG